MNALGVFFNCPVCPLLPTFSVAERVTKIETNNHVLKNDYLFFAIS